MEREIVLGGTSAAYVMCALHEGDLDAQRCQRQSFPPGSCASSVRDIDSLGLGMAKFYLPDDEPMEVAVTAQRECASNTSIRTHLIPQRLPQGALVRAGKHVLMPSPEAYFVRRCADIRDVPECLALGMELAGRYSRKIPGEHCESCTYFCHPLTTARRIAGYVDRAEGMTGVKYARRALPWLLDNSFSPMETLLVTLLVLPPRHRGANLELPQLNPELQVREELRHLTRRDTFKPDIYWPQYALDIEYDSNERHSTPEERESDDERKSDIEALGIRVIPVRTIDMTSREFFERKLGQVVLHMAKHGDEKVRRRLRRLQDRGALDAIDSLRRELLPPLEWAGQTKADALPGHIGYQGIPNEDLGYFVDPDASGELTPPSADALSNGAFLS